MVEIAQKQCDENKRKTKTSTKKLLLYGLLGTVTLVIVLVLQFIDPVQIFMKYYTRVANGSFVHEYMMKKDVPNILLSVYVFNITNPKEFLAGDDKLKLEEIGPFTYQEYRNYDNIEIDLEAEVLRFDPKVKLVFKSEESIGRPEEYDVTMPNIPMLGLASKGSTYGLVGNFFFSCIVTQLNSKALVHKDVNTYLWGYDDPLISLASNVFGLINFDKMGILDRIYDNKTDNHLEASILEEEKFMIKKRNGYKKLVRSPWENPDLCYKCSTFENTYEGIGYPSGLTPDVPLRIFRNGLCKVLDLEFDKKVTTEFGAEVLVYNFSDSFFSDSPNDTSNGILDMSDCFHGVPLGVSKAHFLDVDPKVYERIEGMNPDEKYRGYAVIEPKIGLELDTKITLQINLILGDLSYYSEAKSFSNMVVPICYLYITQPPLPEDSVYILKQMYVTSLYVIITTQVLLLILCILSLSYFIRLLNQEYSSRNSKRKQNAELNSNVS